MKFNFNKKDGLYVEETLGNYYPDVYVHAFLDTKDNETKILTAMDYGYEIVQLTKTIPSSNNNSCPNFNLVVYDQEEHKKRFYKVLFNSEEVLDGTEEEICFSINEEDIGGQA